MFYLIVLMMVLLNAFPSFGSKYYVVERSRGALGVIENQTHTKDIKGLGDMNHAIVKYGKKYAYVISRNGILTKIDPCEDKTVSQAKAGKSSIDFDISKNLIVVSNYDPKTIVFFNHNLKSLKTINTGSRNVGIKFYRNFVISLLMDKNAVWIIDDKDFHVVKKIKNAGIMPFDAIRDDGRYLISFFVGNDIGILNLKDFTYKRISYGHTTGAILKIPHYGLFSVFGDYVLMPAVGERAVDVVDLKKESLVKKIKLLGYPVFVIVSPKKNLIAINYSGDKDDYLTFINPNTMKVVKNLKIARRVMHMRFSKDGNKLYVSDYFDDKVKILDVNNFKVLKEIPIPQPSGIFRLPSHILEGCHG